jgi:hypothetical protein
MGVMVIEFMIFFSYDFLKCSIGSYGSWLIKKTARNFLMNFLGLVLSNYPKQNGINKLEVTAHTEISIVLMGRRRNLLGTPRIALHTP